MELRSFSNQETFSMLILLGECRQKYAAAIRFYAENV